MNPIIYRINELKLSKINNLEDENEEIEIEENIINKYPEQINKDNKLNINDLDNNSENYAKAEINLFDDDEEEDEIIENENLEDDNIIKEVDSNPSSLKKSNDNYVYNERKNNLKKFITSVEPIEENKIEFDIDDLVTPKYMFNNNRQQNNVSINNTKKFN